MSHFNHLPEFDREFKRLAKKYRTLTNDYADFERMIAQNPTGLGKNFRILHDSLSVKIIKTYLFCDSLKGRSLRLIYAFHNDRLDFMYIEIYFKGDKENEDRERIKSYLKSI